MSSTATITAPLGPGRTATALVCNNVTELSVFTDPKSVLRVLYDGGNSLQYFDIEATTTFTCTIASGVITVTISQ